MLFNILIIIIFPLTGAQSGKFGLSSMPPTILTLQMIIDFAVEQQWQQLIFFDCAGNNDCSRSYAKPFVMCLSHMGIQISIKSLTEATDLVKILSYEDTRLGIVIIIDDIDIESENNLFNKLKPNNKTMRPILLGSYVSWLIISTKWNSTQIHQVVKTWPISVDSDFTIAMSFLPADVIQKVWFESMNNTCQELQNYGRSYDYDALASRQTVFPMDTLLVQDTGDPSNTVSAFYVATLYKFRMDNNDSVELDRRGSWTPSRHEIGAGKSLFKLRMNLKLETMNFALWNVSGYLDPREKNQTPEGVDHASSVESLMELISLFSQTLNVSANITTFQAGDLSTTEDLLSAITSETIDLGSVYVDYDIRRSDMLYFTFPITRYRRNIYFKPPETSTNIFLQPFSKKMLLCVLATLVLIIGVMEIINYVTHLIHWKEDREHFGLGEATLWCISIMCMQGSPWTPRTRAGKTVLLGSLIFSLITYNSYSGSITSILSVKTSAINNISDFFDYDYIFACSSDDDVYMTTKPELRSYYLKTLESQQTRVPEQTGLEKAIKGNYAFFITETIAKRILRNALMFKRCQINELQTATPGVLSLPMSIFSPYKKIVNLSILRMWQHGILQRLNLQIKPPLLNCDGVLKYNQAQFMDVYGAFVILLAGAIGAVAIFFLERAWINKKRLKEIHLPVHFPDLHFPSLHEHHNLKAHQDFSPALESSKNILDSERPLEAKKDPESSIGDQYGYKGTDSKEIREFHNYSEFRKRHNELQLIRYSKEQPPLFPYYP